MTFRGDDHDRGSGFVFAYTENAVHVATTSCQFTLAPSVDDREPEWGTRRTNGSRAIRSIRSIRDFVNCPGREWPTLVETVAYRWETSSSAIEVDTPNPEVEVVDRNCYSLARVRECMADELSLDGRTLVGVANDDAGEVSAETTFQFEQEGKRVYAAYSGGDIVDGHLVGTFDGTQWDVRYVQLNENGETATGHSVGTVERLGDGRLRVEDEWEWESKPGTGESVLEEVDR